MDQSEQSELLRRCRQGDAAAWDELISAYFPEAGRFVFLLSPAFSIGDVEAVVSATFQDALKNLLMYGGRNPARTGLLYGAMRAARSHRPKNEKFGWTGSTGADSRARGDAEAVKAHLGLLKALDRLGGPCRDMVVLRYFGNLEVADLAPEFEISEQSMEIRIDKCLSTLAGIMASQGPRGVGIGAPVAQPQQVGHPVAAGLVSYREWRLRQFPSEFRASDAVRQKIQAGLVRAPVVERDEVVRPRTVLVSSEVVAKAIGATLGVLTVAAGIVLVASRTGRVAETEGVTSPSGDTLGAPAGGEPPAEDQETLNRRTELELEAFLGQILPADPPSPLRPILAGAPASTNSLAAMPANLGASLETSPPDMALASGGNVTLVASESVKREAESVTHRANSGAVRPMLPLPTGRPPWVAEQEEEKDPEWLRPGIGPIARAATEIRTFAHYGAVPLVGGFSAPVGQPTAAEPMPAGSEIGGPLVAAVPAAVQVPSEPPDEPLPPEAVQGRLRDDEFEIQVVKADRAVLPTGDPRSEAEERDSDQLAAAIAALDTLVASESPDQALPLAAEREEGVPPRIAAATVAESVTRDVRGASLDVGVSAENPADTTSAFVPPTPTARGPMIPAAATEEASVAPSLAQRAPSPDDEGAIALDAVANSEIAARTPPAGDTTPEGEAELSIDTVAVQSDGTEDASPSDPVPSGFATGSENEQVTVENQKAPVQALSSGGGVSDAAVPASKTITDASTTGTAPVSPLVTVSITTAEPDVRGPSAPVADLITADSAKEPASEAAQPRSRRPLFSVNLNLHFHLGNRPAGTSEDDVPTVLAATPPSGPETADPIAEPPSMAATATSAPLNPPAESFPARDQSAERITPLYPVSVQRPATPPETRVSAPPPVTQPLIADAAESLLVRAKSDIENPVTHDAATDVGSTVSVTPPTRVGAVSGGLAKYERIENVRSLRRNLNSPPLPPVLREFRIAERAGNLVLLDSDGSVFVMTAQAGAGIPLTAVSLEEALRSSSRPIPVKAVGLSRSTAEMLAFEGWLEPAAGSVTDAWPGHAPEASLLEATQLRGEVQIGARQRYPIVAKSTSR